MKMRPLRDRILVERIEESEQRVGGIIIPDTAKEKPQQGRVVAVGKGRVNDKGDVFPLDVFEVNTQALAMRIADNAPAALRWTKQSVNRTLGRPPTEALAQERGLHPGLGHEFFARINRSDWSSRD